MSWARPAHQGPTFTLARSLSKANVRRVQSRHESADEVPGPRELSDPRLLRALAHPLRLALIEVLSVEGPQTATEAGQRLGESPASCSFHLRQLARYGFVEETGEGRGRRRPWRMTQIGTTYTGRSADEEESAAAELLTEMLQARWLERWRRWRRTSRSYPPPWQDVGGSYESVWWVTPAELAELEAEIRSLTMRWRMRLQNPAERPRGALPVEFVSLVFPFRPPDDDGG